jgi:hypothetical protein
MLDLHVVQQMLEKTAKRRPNGSEHDTACNRFILSIALKHFDLPQPMRVAILHQFHPGNKLPNEYIELRRREKPDESRIPFFKELKIFLESTGQLLDASSSRRKLFTLLPKVTDELCVLSILTNGESKELQGAVMWILENATLLVGVSEPNAVHTLTQLQIQKLVYFCTHVLFAGVCYGKKRDFLSSHHLAALAFVVSTQIPQLCKYRLLEPLIEALTLLKLAKVDVDTVEIKNARQVAQEHLMEGPPWRTNSRALMSSWHVATVAIMCVGLKLNEP